MLSLQTLMSLSAGVLGEKSEFI